MAKTFCRCGAIKEIAKPCSKCGQGLKSNHSQTTKQRGYDGDWKRLRAAVLNDNPLCVECEEHGIVKAAEEVHHIVPISVDRSLRLVPSNLKPLCKACHDACHNRAGGHPQGGGVVKCT